MSNPIRADRPLKRVDPPAGQTPPSPGAVWVEDENGVGHRIGGAVQDRTDGITATDLDFKSHRK
jgi:hypothetical protein